MELTNTITLAPNEFSDILLGNENAGKMVNGGVTTIIGQDIDYQIKNAPLESYVKYLIDKFGISNITSQQYTTAGSEKAVKLTANNSTQYGYANIVLYLVMHDKIPYVIEYIASPKNYEKYLPEFEKIVKSFRFADSFSQTSDNETNTNTNETTTNFLGVSDHPYLGIVGLSLTPELSKQIGLNQTKGLLLTSITKDGPADKYGLRGGTNTTTYNGRDIDIGGDVILKIDNREVTKWEDILGYESQKHPGDKVHFTILRDNAVKELDVVLGHMPMPSQPTSQNDNQEKLYNECVNVAGKSLCDFLFKK